MSVIVTNNVLIDSAGSNVVQLLRDQGVAALALIISGFVLYQDYLRKFKLKVRSAGRVTITKNPFLIGMKHACLFLDLLFSNIGSTSGAVEDVAICVYDGARKVILRSQFLITDRTMHLEKGLQPPKMESFISFQVGKRESLVKQIVFTQEYADTPLSFEKKAYTADIFVIDSIAKAWKLATSIEFSIDQEDVDVLSEIKATHQPDGKIFVNWLSRDKQTLNTTERLEALRKRIGV